MHLPTWIEKLLWTTDYAPIRRRNRDRRCEATRRPPPARLMKSALARVDTGSTLYLLDEPSTGLQFDDICCLQFVLNRPVDK